MLKQILVLGLFFVISSCNVLEMGKVKESDNINSLAFLALRGNKINVTGTAIKGVVKNGIVTVNSLNSDGTCSSTALATEKTDSSGNYSLNYLKTGSSICVIVSPSPDGTSLIYDEQSGKTMTYPVSSKFRLTTIYPESKFTNNKKENFLLSPFSRMLTKRIQYLVKKSGGIGSINQLHTRASKELVIRFGLNKGLGVTSSRSVSKSYSTSDPSIPEMENILFQLKDPNSALTAKFVSILLGFSHLANKYKSADELTVDDIEAIMDALASDFADGVIDGKDENGNSITMGLGANKITLSSDPLKDLLLPAINSYFQQGGTWNVGNGNIPITLTSTTVTSEIEFLGTVAIEDGSTTTASSSFTIGGTITGLTSSGLVLQNNSGDNLTISSGSTSFTFPTSVSSGSTFNVSVSTQPSGQTCVVSNGTGIALSNISTVAINCGSPNTVGGSVSGLTTSGLVLQLNGGNDLTINSGSSSYVFSPGVISGMAYNVTIKTNPTGLSCSISNSTGTAGGNVTNANVICVNSGVFSIKATWSRNGDLDLAVGTPNASNIQHGSPTSAAVGTDYAIMDRDASDMGPENIYWATATPPPSGNYHICLDTHGFSPAIDGANPVNYTVIVTKNGVVTNTFTGTYSSAVSASGCNSGSTNKIGTVSWP